MNLIDPKLLSTLFESSLSAKKRRAQGIHYTSESDILKIVQPCIVDHWQEKINQIDSLESLITLHKDFKKYRVLDPACGSGNFLLIAYRELKKIENQFFNLYSQYTSVNYQRAQKDLGYYSIKNICGIELDEQAVQLTKVSLWLTYQKLTNPAHQDFDFKDLQNIIQGDALDIKWQDVDVVISNPPFLGGHRIRQEKGDQYIAWLNAKFPKHNKKSDYCTYWYKKILQDCRPGIKVGLVSTNSITQNTARENSLEPILESGGTIFNAYTSFPWTGSAKVHVSIVNFVNKGSYFGIKKLNGKSVVGISARLKNTNVINLQSIIKPNKLAENLNLSFMGVIPNVKGFVLSVEEAEEISRKNPKNKECLKVFMTGRDLNQGWTWSGSRMIIDFQDWPLEKAQEYKECFEIVKNKVKPQRLNTTSTGSQIKKNQKYWWKYEGVATTMRQQLKPLKQFIATSRVSKHLLFAMISNNQNIMPDNTLFVFASSSFSFMGILSSKLHIVWAKYQGSTLKEDHRYTNTTCFESFPFPSDKENPKVSQTMEKIERYRKEVCQSKQHGLTTLYNQMFDGGHETLRQLHKQLDHAVADLYGFPVKDLNNEDKIIDFICQLNQMKHRQQ